MLDEVGPAVVANFELFKTIGTAAQKGISGITNVITCARLRSI